VPSWKSFTDPETRVFQGADTDSEDFVILVCIVFIRQQGVTDRQTRMQTDAFVIAETGNLHSMLLC